MEGIGRDVHSFEIAAMRRTFDPPDHRTSPHLSAHCPPLTLRSQWMPNRGGREGGHHLVDNKQPTI